ncbi:MAG: tetratricopeptide repeat protein [Acidobacteria bacterium]|nr:tetratricopeptide repeat protein [Acidobacteriota bacterium]
MKRVREGFDEGETVQSLTGFGGIGKTQTALEYAYRHRQVYKDVLWVNAHSRETLVAEFAAIAGHLNLPEKDAKDHSEAVGAVKVWLENNSAWLLILDNADEIEMAQEFIPSSESGHILLTTRAHAIGAIGEGKKLEKMTPKEGALFLLRRLRKLKKDEALDFATAEIRAQAEALSALVDGLPLALDQAAAFIEEKPSTLGEYQSLYQSEREELLKRRGKLAKSHPSVTVTFSLAFKKVEEANSPAADLLRVCAFLEADSIPEEIFSEGAEELGDAIGSLAGSPLKLSDAIEEACRFSLLQRDPEARTVSLHRLVQAVLRDEMDKETEWKWAERAVHAVSSVFPDAEFSNWELCGRLTPHAQSLAGVIEKFGFEFTEAAVLIGRTGYYLNERAQYAETEPLYRVALGIYEKALGAEHPAVATSLNNLAELYSNQGKYAEAEPLLKRALLIYEKALGAEHPDVATSLNNLAGLYKNQGKYAEAEPLYKRDLAISEKALGAEHPDVATSLNNLAGLYRNQGKYAEAEPLYQRALEIKEKALGKEHPDVATIFNNLALLHDNQGKYAEAKPLLKRALLIYEKALGEEHPLVATSLNNLAVLYRNQEKYTEAEPLYKRALAIREKVFGTEHPYVATVLENYAALLRAMERDTEAEMLEARASTLRTRLMQSDP